MKWPWNILYNWLSSGAKKEISSIETETKQAQMHLKHANADIKKKQSDLKKTDTAYKKDRSAHDALVGKLEQMKVSSWTEKVVMKKFVTSLIPLCRHNSLMMTILFLIAFQTEPLTTPEPLISKVALVVFDMSCFNVVLLMILFIL